MIHQLTTIDALVKRVRACQEWCAHVGLLIRDSKMGRGFDTDARWTRVLLAARSFSDPDKDDQNMAWHVLEAGNVSPDSGLASPTTRREQRIRNDADRREMASAMTLRLAERPPDALGHFLTTSGYALEDLADLPTPAVHTRERPQSPETKKPLLQWDSPRRSAMLVAAVVLYTVSLGWGGSDPWIQGAMMDSDSDAVSWTMLGARSRGADSEWVMDVRSGYLRGFSQLEEARTSVLGLFPGYDREMLERAVITFTETAELQALREPPSSRMLLLMARLQERLGNQHTAERWIHIVIQRDDDQLDEALQLRSHLMNAAHRF